MLHPLIALLLEKCEQATEILGLSGDRASGSGFNTEVQAFIHHQQKQGKAILGADPEVDALVSIESRLCFIGQTVTLMDNRSFTPYPTTMIY